MDRPDWERTLTAVAYTVLSASVAVLSYKVSDAIAEGLLSIAFVFSAFILYLSSTWGSFSNRWKIIILLVCLAFPAYYSAKFLLLERKTYMLHMGIVEKIRYVHQVAKFAKKSRLVNHERMLRAYEGKRLIGEGEVYAIRVFGEVVDLTMDHEFGYLYFRFSRDEWDKCCPSLVRGSWAVAEGMVERMYEDRIHFVDSKLRFPLVDEKPEEGAQR